ncbi:type IV pilus assembly protein FimV [Halopseudomonas xiamenensis]|uniref:type IV pilus assembly protein FimV n=1 Tax=Halopseudomonas xiamenensis TaxID=157792 RepID=UPI001626EBE8|nr:FimV/HubP family polar landmark protein [Halopseudomonas xiamenensis]
MTSLAVLYAGVSHALGLGELQLESALHQPLRATISLNGAQGLQPGDVRISLADAEAFSRVGIERPHFLTDLRFTPVMLGQQLAVRVESNRPVNEPYLNFLVQLHRPGGLLLREYTLLLDPPLYQPTPIMEATVLPQPVAVPVVATPAPSPRVQPSLPALQPQVGAGQYQTASGDSLWSIASATRPDESVAVRTQMLAIRALNPDAFVDGDMDRLRTGRTLILPTVEQVGGSPASVAGSTPVAPVSTGREVLPAVAAPLPAHAGQSDRLRIEEPALQAAALENEELKNRLGVLESRFNVLLAELDTRDRQIASLQAELDVMRRARDAQLAAVPAVVQADEATRFSSASAQAGVLLPDADGPAVPGAVEAQQPSAELAPPAVEPQPSIMNWWPALLALLVLIAGTIILRLRRGPEPEPVVALRSPTPEPVAMPGSKTADPLEGVELYITYGRLVEARDLLDKAINAEPQRVDLRQRQLAVLAELGDATAFAEQEALVLEMGGDRARVDQLKARFPQMEQQRPRQSGPVEPLQEAPAALLDESADSVALDLDSFELDADWDLIDQLDVDNPKPQVAEQVALSEPFESNLKDFPEVGELDEGFADHFAPASNPGSNS